MWQVSRDGNKKVIIIVAVQRPHCSRSALYRASCLAEMKNKKSHEENVAQNVTRMEWNATNSYRSLNFFFFNQKISWGHLQTCKMLQYLDTTESKRRTSKI